LQVKVDSIGFEIRRTLDAGGYSLVYLPLVFVQGLGQRRNKAQCLELGTSHLQSSRSMPGTNAFTDKVLGEYQDC
jgi:hypothetical protein